MARLSWPLLRTAIAAVGLGFAGASLAAACLDHYGESSACEASTGSGSADNADCGAPTTMDAAIGSGSGSAAAP